MDHSELVSLIIELQELNERFIIRLTMFTEGAQGFHGNLRLLLDPYLFQKCEYNMYERAREQKRYPSGLARMHQTENG